MNLRQTASTFAANAGFAGALIKLVENKVASRFFNRPAWDVYVKADGAGRGRKIGSVVFEYDSSTTLTGAL